MDIFALLNATTAKINTGGFANQYEFERELGNISMQAYDGHYTMRGNTFVGAIRWRRGTGASAALVSLSSDGAVLPKIYLACEWPPILSCMLGNI